MTARIRRIEPFETDHGRRQPAGDRRGDPVEPCLELFDDKQLTRRQAVEDVLWALLNTPEFVFKD